MSLKISSHFKKPIQLTLFIFTSIVCLLFGISSSAQNLEISISIHIRGVYNSNVSLIPLSGSKRFKPISYINGVKNGESVVLKVLEEYLPGEFVIRFEYKEKQESSLHPSEKKILINKQNIELWVNPLYVNNPDSTWFQKNEMENTAFTLFSKENIRHVEKLTVLQNFLMNYDQPKSKLFKQACKEFEDRRQEYNNWLILQTLIDSSLFVSSIYRFNYVPQISWEGSEENREQNVILHFFDGIDLNNNLIIKTTRMNDWMNDYVNLHMKMIKNMSMRDSIISSAATTAIEKSKQGSPLVYGWMVDYFYQGFEANNIPSGMKSLEPYLNDPNCLTSKRMEIERRLSGLKTLVTGIIAPEIMMIEANGNMFKLSTYKPDNRYILLLFWSADCNHCVETVNTLYPWLQAAAQQSKVTVVAISLDETETEVNAWNQKIKELTSWMHIRAAEGVRSKVASDYFILATPVMIVIDSKTKEIISIPTSVSEFQSIL